MNKTRTTTATSQTSQPELEQAILKFWEEKGVFAKTLAKQSPAGDFVFYEGPPTANGRPGIHHVLARSFKDLIPRYKTMRGFRAARKAGWDTHGLPVELAVEKKLKISGKKQIESLRQTAFDSIKYFNEQCRRSVWQYKDEWEKLTKRMGFWIDLENPYITYEPQYIESLWWIIKQIWEQGLIYQDYKVLPYCPRCGTALSSHEVAQGYKDDADRAVYVKFKLKSGQKIGGFIADDNTYVLSWTTTPWTLPGNVALAVGKDIEYTITKNDGEDFILAKDIFDASCRDEALPRLYKEMRPDVIKIIKGKDLVGLEYEPLFPGAIPENTKNYQNAFKVYAADFVNTEEGAGIVHTAVMYGEDDYRLGQEVGLPKQHTVDEEGKFSFPRRNGQLTVPTEDILNKLNGKFVKDAKTDELVINYLRGANLLLAEEKYLHSYPHCWRCDTPLLYYAKSSWFIAMSKLRERLLLNNEKINWHPEHLKNGRFGNWLSEVKDWAFSRERYWGTPLPIWVCAGCDNKICIGSFKELEQMAKGRKGEKGGKQEIERRSSVASAKDDPHRPFIDEIKLRCEKCQGEMARVPEVADVWFDSGAMPFAQYHYPFDFFPPSEDKSASFNPHPSPPPRRGRESVGLPYPADYICEAVDQTRGWFYTLLSVAALLEKRTNLSGAPFRNAVSLGHILDKHGKKMSKSKGNIVEPSYIFDKYGADVLRWYFFTCSDPGEPKNFDELDLVKTQRRMFITLNNIFNFYKLYGSGHPRSAASAGGPSALDRWILSKLASVNQSAGQALDNYDIAGAARALENFVNEDISTWYLRRCRERFKSGDGRALETFRQVLEDLSKMLAPFIPFTAEKLWQDIKAPGEQAESVHLCDWPASLAADRRVLEEMEKVRNLSAKLHELRAQAGIKVRQPLPEARIKEKLSSELRQILAEEVNVIIVKCQMSKVKSSKGWLVSEDSEAGLNVELTDDLRGQGLLRELTRQINSLRKQHNFSPSDKIKIFYRSDSAVLQDIFSKFADDIKKAAIANDIIEVKAIKDGRPLNINNETLFVSIEKI